MKFFITVLLSSLLSRVTLAQNPKLDSLEKLIRIAKNDTTRINLMNEKLAMLGRVNLDAAITAGNSVINQAKSISYKPGEARARVIMASNYCMKGAFPLAAQNLTVSKSIYQSLKDSAGLCRTYSGYGMMYGMQSRYDTSIYYLKKAIAIGERNHYKNLLSTFYENIAIGYQMQADYKNALFYQQKALDLARADNDLISQAYTNLNIGLTYMGLDDLVRSKRFLLDAIRLAKKEGINNVELYAYSNLGDLYSRTKEADKAYELALRAARLGRQMGDYGIQAASLSKAAEYLSDRNQLASAESLAKQAIRIADSSGQTYNKYQAYAAMGSVVTKQGKYQPATAFLKKSLDVLDDTDIYSLAVGSTYRNLSVCYEKTGDLSNALATYKRSSQIIDSVRNRDNIRKATELSMNYEFDKQQQTRQIEQTNKDAITQSRQVALISSSVLTLILALVSFRAYRTKQRANARLHQQNEEIQHTLTKLERTQTQLIQKEKMASLGELTAGIAHEIQNPLNFVTNFSEVSAELVDELAEEHQRPQRDLDMERELLRDLSENLTKINHHGRRASNIVKGMLEHARPSTGVIQPTNLNALTEEYLRLAYVGMRAKDKNVDCQLVTQFDPAIGNVALVAQEIGQVLLNLFNNAFYATQQRQEQGEATYQPAVTVSTKKTPDGIQIQVSDNGTGMSQSVQQKVFQPFFTTKPTGEGTGLGLSLSYDIITKGHGGSLLVTSREGAGSEFTIDLPTPKANM